MFIGNPDYRFSAEKIEERKRHVLAFPNQKSDGSFTPHSTIVEVAVFRRGSVEAALQAGNLMNVRQDIQVLCHEMTHWFDFFGTRWGRNYAIAICKALRAMERRREDGFPDIVSLFDLDRRVLLPAYYQHTRPPRSLHGLTRPWSIEFSAGMEIDPKGQLDSRLPLLFVKFGEHDTKETFARQPISVGALLEARATSSELNEAIRAIHSEPDENVRRVELVGLEREFASLVYDHRLIEYNAAAHIVAFHARTTEVALTYRLAAALALVALNMSEQDFNLLRPPKEFAILKDGNRVFRRNQDRGYAFACLVWNAGQYDGDEAAYVARSLVQSNLDDEQTILARAAASLEQPLRLADVNPSMERFIKESEAGGAICAEYARQVERVVTLDMLSGPFRDIAPPFIDGTGEFFELRDGRIEQFQADERHEAAHALRDYTNNLLAGCRGLRME
ncbi:hypothetical protein ACFHWW_23160 [Ensifer sp. P24N7]|uniref:hypothetical protein n=1 Tax=Sinorhizobium sp. P24N7 TaxID=3348358 RepID=UPI0035F25D97